MKKNTRLCRYFSFNCKKPCANLTQGDTRERYNNMDYSSIEFEEQYIKVYNEVEKEGVPQKNHAVIFLGGQPGVGKSNFYTQDNNLNGYIVIDGDKYRKYHPHYNEIIRLKYKKRRNICRRNIRWSRA